MAKKRANGEGNIRKRKDGRWEGRYTAGYDPKTGKRLIKNVLGKTQAEVKEKLKTAIAESQDIEVRKSDDEYTVAAWLRTWYELYAKPNVRTATANRYELIIEQYTVPRIGNIKLKKLTTQHLQKLYKELLESGRIHVGKGQDNGLSTTTVHSVHLMLHCALERAVKERLIYEAPQIARNAPLTAAAPAMAVNPEPADVISDVGAAPLSDEQLLELRKGQRAPAAGYLSGTVEVYLTGQRLGNADIDPYVFLLDENEKCRGEGDLVFFGNERSPDGAVRYYPDDGHISIDMAKLPPEVQRISVAYSVYSGDSVKNFSQVREPRVALFSQGKERVRFDIPGLTNEITIIAMEFYIYRGEWRISAVGAGYRDGLVKLCSRYGIQAST